MSRRHGAPMSRRILASARRVPSWVRRPRRWTTVTGTARRVAVVQSDIVSSTQLLEAAGAEYPRVLVRHRSLIAAAVARRGGSFLTHAGDGTMAVFERPDAALLASVEAQRALAAEPWPEGLAPRVRMSVHAGDVFHIDGEPVGLAINHGARIMAVARAGQVMVSVAAAEAAEAEAAGGVGRGRGPAVADAGWHELRDHCGPVRLRQLVADGLTVVLPGRDGEAFVPEVPLARDRVG